MALRLAMRPAARRGFLSALEPAARGDALRARRCAAGDALCAIASRRRHSRALSSLARRRRRSPVLAGLRRATPFTALAGPAQTPLDGP